MVRITNAFAAGFTLRSKPAANAGVILGLAERQLLAECCHLQITRRGSGFDELHQAAIPLLNGKPTGTLVKRIGSTADLGLQPDLVEFGE